MSASNRVKTVTGRCPEHGVVRAVKEIPRPRWPFVVYLWQLIAAARAPYTCPRCGRPVQRS
jgi:hypothetical protein